MKTQPNTSHFPLSENDVCVFEGLSVAGYAEWMKNRDIITVGPDEHGLEILSIFSLGFQGEITYDDSEKILDLQDYWVKAYVESENVFSNLTKDEMDFLIFYVETPLTQRLEQEKSQEYIQRP